MSEKSIFLLPRGMLGYLFSGVRNKNRDKQSYKLFYSLLLSKVNFLES